MTMSEWIVLVVPIFNFTVLVILLFQSRRWTGPAQSVRLEIVEGEHKVLRGNLRRLERDAMDYQRQTTDCLEKILDEVRIIKENGAHEHPLAEKVSQIVDRVEDLEQAIHGLPCGQGAAPCPAKEK